MKWLKDKNSVTDQELRDAADDASAAADAASDVASAAVAADAASDVAAEKWLRDYFECSVENKQDYIDELTKTNPNSPIKVSEIRLGGSVIKVTGGWTLSIDLAREARES